MLMMVMAMAMMRNRLSDIVGLTVLVQPCDERAGCFWQSLHAGFAKITLHVQSFHSSAS